jgi:pyruvate,water dikinase
MFTFTFQQEGCLDSRLVGGKAHGLAFMAAAGVPIAPGFTVTTKAYHAFLDAYGLRTRIADVFSSLDVSSVTALEGAEHTIMEWLEAVPVPEVVASEVGRSYQQLCDAVGQSDISVAVRSSATSEDAEGTSFAGEYDTYVGIRGQSDVMRHVVKCWKSAFTARSLAYVFKNGLWPLDIAMAVVIQKVVNARAAGVMFTLSPLTGDRSRIVIEAAYGLGLSVVGGEVTPDRYSVRKIGLDIADRVLGEKHIEYLSGDRASPVEEARRLQFCLSDEEIVDLANYGKFLERQHQHPVDIEFAVDRDLSPGQQVVLLQCRPETYWTSKHAAHTADRVGNAATAVLASVQRIGRATDGFDKPIFEEK